MLILQTVDARAGPSAVLPLMRPSSPRQGGGTGAGTKPVADVDSSQPTGRLASEPPTRPVSGAEASAPMRGAPSRGVVLGRYRLEERLGAGGFGVVWRARDERLEREVAVKVIPRADHGGAGDRPFREARAAARLNHPGIVALYEMGADAESVLLVSELVHGHTFAELVRADAVSDRDVARVGAALADALGHAHDRGVIHRDVKPQNVIVVAEPSAGAGFAKLTDFGVAHLVGDDPLTHTGDIVGTLAYMAPEQAEGRRPTAACDTYALALTLYEALSGENPMRGRSPAETARLVGRHAPPLFGLRRDLPRDLCATIDACLEPRPERRAPLGELREAIAEAAPNLDARGGLVDPGTLARFGLLRREEREEPEPPLPRTAPTRREPRPPDPWPAEPRLYEERFAAEPRPERDERRRPRPAPAPPPSASRRAPLRRWVLRRSSPRRCRRSGQSRRCRWPPRRGRARRRSHSCRGSPGSSPPPASSRGRSSARGSTAPRSSRSLRSRPRRSCCPGLARPGRSLRSRRC